ncbi:unnamed protein product [Pseudo-nitzschia multistriata]|uniref:Uncharacterized protein n=1 Tax=Pseudo-nitzschia multistriata TaxID=183589 RepID=A0A448ZDE0_9STRA|nr:unnamed protein product [Pseudo-nitzschia multistriata]
MTATKELEHEQTEEVGSPDATADSNDAARTSAAFAKFKTFLPYVSNDKNTTVGMPRVKAKDNDIDRETTRQLHLKEIEIDEEEEAFGVMDLSSFLFDDSCSPIFPPAAASSINPGSSKQISDGSQTSAINHSSSEQVSRISEASSIHFMSPKQSSNRSVASTVNNKYPRQISNISEATSIHFISPKQSSNRSVASTVNNKYPRHISNISEASIEYFTTVRSPNNTERKRTSFEIDRMIEEDASRDIINFEMRGVNAFQDKERLNISEDIYSFVFACPYWSKEFWFAIYFICTKYICFGILMSNISMDNQYHGCIMVQVVKFFLIPVAISMQEDLITVFYNTACKRYDGLVSRRFVDASLFKWTLANSLRFVDGILSLSVNFFLMLCTNTTLNIFLNFAALHFLQFIDDVLYRLAEQGFFGESMEWATVMCKQITFPRRAIIHGERYNNFMTHMDTIFLFMTGFVCVGIYGYVYKNYYNDDDYRIETDLHPCDAIPETSDR